MTTIEKAKARLESDLSLYGNATSVFSCGDELFIEFKNGLSLLLHGNEISCQAYLYDKEKELDQTELVAYLMTLTGECYVKGDIEQTISKKLNRDVEFYPTLNGLDNDYLHHSLFIYDNDEVVDWEIVFEVLIGTNDFLYLKGIERVIKE